MNSVEIERKILTRISEWEHFKQSEWARPNSNFTPSSNIWYRVSILPSSSKMVGMSDHPCTRETGICVIQIFGAENEGTKKIKTMADSLSKHLSYFKAGQLELLAASLQSVGERDGYYQLNLNCSYRFN